MGYHFRRRPDGPFPEFGSRIPPAATLAAQPSLSTAAPVSGPAQTVAIDGPGLNKEGAKWIQSWKLSLQHNAATEHGENRFAFAGDLTLQVCVKHLKMAQRAKAGIPRIKESNTGIREVLVTREILCHIPV